MKIFSILIFAIAFHSVSYSSEVIMHTSNNQEHAFQQALVASHLEAASHELCALLKIDKKLEKDPPLEEKLDCGLEVMATLAQAARANESDEIEQPLNSPEHSEDSDMRDQISTPPLPPLPSNSEALSAENTYRQIEKRIDDLTKRLGDEFMIEIFYPWFQQNRMRIHQMAYFEELSYPDALLLCTLEMYAKKDGTLSETRQSTTLRALSTILSSGTCSTTDWKLAPNHAWAKPVFFLMKDKKVQRTAKRNQKGIAQALYTVLSHPQLDIEKRRDLFFYLVDPKSTISRYYNEKSTIGENTINTIPKQTPLMWAAQFGHTDNVTIIIAMLRDKRCLKKEINRKDALGLSAIDHACKHSRTNIVELLAYAKATPSEKTLVTLVQKKNIECLRTLIHHVEVSERVYAEACKKGRACVKKLIENNERIKDVITQLKKNLPITDDNLYQELQQLPEELDSSDNNGVVAGLYLLRIKGYLDIDDDEESSE